MKVTFHQRLEGGEGVSHCQMFGNIWGKNILGEQIVNAKTRGLSLPLCSRRSKTGRECSGMSRGEKQGREGLDHIGLVNNLRLGFLL